VFSKDAIFKKIFLIYIWLNQQIRTNGYEGWLHMAEIFCINTRSLFLKFYSFLSFLCLLTYANIHTHSLFIVFSWLNDRM
jgi:hypothetical protein